MNRPDRTQLQRLSNQCIIAGRLDYSNSTQGAAQVDHLFTAVTLLNTAQRTCFSLLYVIQQSLDIRSSFHFSMQFNFSKRLKTFLFETAFNYINST